MGFLDETGVENMTSDIKTMADATYSPIDHASSSNTYGLGTTSNYGHVKTINNLTTSAHADGLALSAYQGKLLNDAVGNIITTSSSSASGRYARSIKFSNGIMIGLISNAVEVAVTTQWGSVYYGVASMGNWHTAFTSSPYTVVSISGGNDGWCNLDAVGATSCGDVYVYRPNLTQSASYTIVAIGIGTWK